MSKTAEVNPEKRGKMKHCQTKASTSVSKENDEQLDYISTPMERRSLELRG